MTTPNLLEALRKDPALQREGLSVLEGGSADIDVRVATDQSSKSHLDLRVSVDWILNTDTTVFAWPETDVDESGTVLRSADAKVAALIAHHILQLCSALPPAPQSEFETLTTNSVQMQRMKRLCVTSHSVDEKILRDSFAKVSRNAGWQGTVLRCHDGGDVELEVEHQRADPSFWDYRIRDVSTGEDLLTGKVFAFTSTHAMAKIMHRIVSHLTGTQQNSTGKMNSIRRPSEDTPMTNLTKWSVSPSGPDLSGSTDRIFLSFVDKRIVFADVDGNVLDVIPLESILDLSLESRTSEPVFDFAPVCSGPDCALLPLAAALNLVRMPSRPVLLFSWKDGERLHIRRYRIVSGDAKQFEALVSDAMPELGQHN